MHSVILFILGFYTFYTKRAFEQLLVTGFMKGLQVNDNMA